MPLHESAKTANVVGSLQVYLTAELAAFSLDFGGGIPFQDGDLTEWLQIRALEPVRPAVLAGPYAGRGGEQDPDARGGEMFWLLNVNCFVRPAKMSPPNNLRLWTIRDLAAAPLMPGTRIAVKDHAGEAETIGYLFVDEILADQPVAAPDRPDVLQHNLAFALRWAETWVVSR